MHKKYLLIFIYFFSLLFSSKNYSFDLEQDSQEEQAVQILLNLAGQEPTLTSEINLKEIKSKRKRHQRQQTRAPYLLPRLQSLQENIAQASGDTDLLQEIVEIEEVKELELEQNAITNELENMNRLSQEIRGQVKEIKNTDKSDSEYIDKLRDLRDKFYEYIKENEKYKKTNKEEAKRYNNVLTKYMRSNEVGIRKIEDIISKVAPKDLSLENMNRLYKEIRYQIKEIKSTDEGDSEYINKLKALRDKFYDYMEEYKKYRKIDDKKSKRLKGNLITYMTRRKLGIENMEKRINEIETGLSIPKEKRNMEKVYQEIKEQAEIVVDMDESNPEYINKLKALRDKFYEYIEENDKYKKIDNQEAKRRLGTLKSYMSHYKMGIKKLENKIEELESKAASSSIEVISGEREEQENITEELMDDFYEEMSEDSYENLKNKNLEDISFKEYQPGFVGFDIDLEGYITQDSGIDYDSEFSCYSADSEV